MTVASLGLAILSPIMLWIAWRVRRDVGSPVLFRQERPGLHGEPFTMIKFRSMRDERASDGTTLSQIDRLTPFGSFLRASSLDEIPELWNVLRGDMSLVGPRPLLTEYLPRYTPEQMRRHDVLPGITGLAQVSGRNAIDWDEKFDLDCWYVDHWSFWLDLKILARTAMRVVSREGIQHSADTTMPLFTGTEASERVDTGGGRSGP